MNKTMFKALALVACTMAITSCTEEMEWKDAGVTAPEELFLPDDGKAIELQASATASVAFEWGSSSAEDGGAPSYEVVFDEVGGDFSEPLYKVTADLGGSLNKATILHKTLNRIAGVAGAGGGESASLQWTVFAYRGLNKVQATQARTVKLTRYFGFDEIPGAVYVLNSAESQPIACASPESGIFEVFVELSAAKGITLNSKADGSGTSYCIKGNKMDEGNTAYNVSEDGVYRLRLDFETASVLMINKIAKVQMNFCGKVRYDLDYVGNGVFQGTHEIPWLHAGWGYDERYKFWMIYESGTQTNWGTKNSTDGRPNVDGKVDDTNPYFFTAETSNSAYDQQKWKLDTWTDAREGMHPGQKTKISLIFNVANYTHRIERP